MLRSGEENKNRTPTEVSSSTIEHYRIELATRCLLSTPMGVDYVVIGFDMEVQPLVTQNAA